MSPRLLVTGSAGLVGSEVVLYFDERGWEVVGVDNNLRRAFFGTDGDTSANQRELQARTARYSHHNLDIRDRDGISQLFKSVQPDLVVHTAAQPSHEYAASHPVLDFEVNAGGTLNVLEATRQHTPQAVFVHLSTNKVYGDGPNGLALIEQDTRWEYADPAFHNGISETFPIDQNLHSLFGASKVAADIMVQEYGRYYGLKTACLRAGCLTGGRQAGVELHGFLSYLVRANLERRPYTIYGYKGKQVRDNLHARDIASAIEVFAANPRPGAVFNIGGGRANAVSLLEVMDIIEARTGRAFQSAYMDEPRRGDHICYITDLTHIQRQLPDWRVSVSLDAILDELISTWDQRLARGDCQ